jgi:hypothetical protein
MLVQGDMCILYDTTQALLQATYVEHLGFIKAEISCEQLNCGLLKEGPVSWGCVVLVY